MKPRGNASPPRTVAAVVAILDAIEREADGAALLFYSLTEAAQILGVSAECVRWYDTTARVPLPHIAGRRVLSRDHILQIATLRAAVVRGRHKRQSPVIAAMCGIDHGE